MKRLTGEHHHVVGDVDDVVMRTNAQATQALDHPIGRGPNLHVSHDASDIAIAQSLVGNLDGNFVCRSTAGLGLNGGQLHVVIAIEDGARLARHANHGQAIGAVGRDLAIKHGIGRAVVLAKGHTNGSILGQDHDACVVAADAQLARRAVHAKARDTTELGFLDLDAAGQLGANHGGHDMVSGLEVLGTANNLQRLGVALGVDVFVAHRDLAHIHVVAIGMWRFLEHLSRDHMVKALAHNVDSLDLGTGANILVRKLLGALGHIDHSLEPVVRNAHLALLFI